MRAILLDRTPSRGGNNLRGYAKVKVTVPGVPVGVSADGQPWAKIPGKAVVRDGQQQVDGDGKPRWEPCFELTTSARTSAAPSSQRSWPNIPAL